MTATAGFSIQRSGFTRVPELFYAIQADMVANGFLGKFPAGAPAAPVAGQPYAPFKITLEAGPTIDPLNATQPWRIQFDAKADQLGDVIIGTPFQLPNDGTTSFMDGDFAGTNFPMGILTTPTNTDLNASGADPTNRFIGRGQRIKTIQQALSYPMSYRLSITDHGMALFVWEEGSDADAKNFSWFVCQRPVDHITGVPLQAGHCPLVCLFGLTGGVYKFIARENDVNRPTRPVIATQDSEDSHAIINAQKQVAITENNRYVITFPNGINTARYMYTEELDLIAYTSADVISQYSDVPITVYGEAAARTYKAMQANGAFNTGMRMLVLVKGAGIA